jgi:hypothetical protein
MKASDRLIAKLKRVMEEEIRLFDEFIQQEEGLNRLIKERDWNHVEAAFESLGLKAGCIENSEEKRSQVYNALKEQLELSKEDPFSALLSGLAVRQRHRLEVLQSKIKERLLKVKSISNGLIYYLRCMQESTDQILGALFPHRKGKIYSNTGHAAERGEDSVMINHKL